MILNIVNKSIQHIPLVPAPHLKTHTSYMTVLGPYPAS